MTPGKDPAKKKPAKKASPARRKPADPHQPDLFDLAGETPPAKPKRPRAKKSPGPPAAEKKPKAVTKVVPAPRQTPAASPAPAARPAAADKSRRMEADYAGGTPPSTVHVPYLFLAVAAYVAVVLVYDTFVTRGDVRTINWSAFAWRPAHLADLLQPFAGQGPTKWLRAPLLERFDLFKLTAWGLIPFLLCLWRLDTGWFGTSRWKRSDRTLLLVCCVMAVAAVGLVRFVPQLAEIYPPAPSGWTFSKRLLMFGGGLLWVVSWLPAYEFLHRYFLLRRVAADFPKYGWLVVPLSDTLYHLQKPPLEAAGMLVFSLLATWWTLKRRNLLLPLLVHLVIEVVLQILLVV